MKNVLAFPPQTPFEFAAPRAEEVPEGAVVLTGLALTAWLPTIMWCSALNQTLPLDLIALSELLGGMIGLALYHSPPSSLPPCVPMSSTPDVPKDRGYTRLRKAA
jgi:presenilin-like A22 family membrane protease